MLPRFDRAMRLSLVVTLATFGSFAAFGFRRLSHAASTPPSSSATASMEPPHAWSSSPLAMHEGHAHGAASPGASLVTDPVCTMSIQVGPDTLRVHDGDHDVYFCSASCRDAYVANAAQYK